MNAAEAGMPDLVLLDLRLPDMSGIEVIRELRKWTQVPIVVLSGVDAETQKVAALEAGADDYVTKPFGPEELAARVRAVLRRTGGGEPEEPLLRFDRLHVDLARKLVTIDGVRVELTKTEYGLLEQLARHPGKLLTHEWLLKHVWGPGYSTESNYLRVYVRQLRKKLGDEAAHPRLIATETGVGYRWLPEPS